MKKNQIFYLLIVITVVLTITSCSSVYMPNIPATPMFKNQGEGYLAAHINTKGNISANAGIAVTDHIAILANGSSVDRGLKSDNHFKQRSAEGALGYYTKMGKRKLQVLEFYAGYGVGNIRDIDQRATIIGYAPVESRLIDYNKIFVQVNYSSTKKSKIKLFGEQRELNYGTAIRLSRVGMTNFTINNIETDKEENLFIEPVFFTRLQLVKGLQLQYTTGYFIGVVNNKYLKSGNSAFTFGLTYNFGKK